MATWGNQQQLGAYLFNYPLHKKTPPPKSVPTWEKNFCWKVGNVPWRRLEETKKYEYQHQSIGKWDDSAVKNAFKKAKRRYWAAINGQPITRDVSMPPPYMYIDEIDWESPIDPELILDLEKSLEPRSDGGDNKMVDDREAMIVGLASVGVCQSKYCGVGWGDEFEDHEEGLENKEKNVPENYLELPY